MSEEIIIRCKNCKHWTANKTCDVLWDRIVYSEIFVPQLHLQVYKDMYDGNKKCYLSVHTGCDFSCIYAELKD